MGGWWWSEGAGGSFVFKVWFRVFPVYWDVDLKNYFLYILLMLTPFYLESDFNMKVFTYWFALFLNRLYLSPHFYYYCFLLSPGLKPTGISFKNSSGFAKKYSFYTISLLLKGLKGKQMCLQRVLGKNSLKAFMFLLVMSPGKNHAKPVLTDPNADFLSPVHNGIYPKWSETVAGLSKVFPELSLFLLCFPFPSLSHLMLKQALFQILLLSGVKYLMHVHI